MSKENLKKQNNNIIQQNNKKNNEKDERKKYYIYAIVSVAVLVLLAIAFAYAYFSMNVTNQDTLTTITATIDCMNIEFIEEGNMGLATLDYEYPIADDYAMQNVVPITVRVVNNCTNNIDDVDYTIALTILSDDIDQTDPNDKGYIPDTKIRYKVLRKLGTDNENAHLGIDYLSNNDRITSGTVYNYLMNDLNERTITKDYQYKRIYKIDSASIPNNQVNVYKIYLWIDYYEGDSKMYDPNNTEAHDESYDNKTMAQKFKASVSLITNATATGSKVNDYAYKEDILNGADPVYNDNLIPVNIADDGAVTKADYTQEWYKYENKKWANAVMLSDTTQTYENGDTIPESNIKGYFVWIPKYKYKIFDMGNYTTHSGTTKPATSIEKTIEIDFGIPNTTDTDTSCAAPMTSGGSGNCAVGKWMTHPAFISMNSNGLWVAKFETTGAINALTSKPGITSLRNQTIKAMFDASYNYSRDNDSHMMKNTEWGAVAYLSHSQYGINDEVRINNNSDFITGYASTSVPTCYAITSSSCNEFGNTAAVTQPYNTSTGYKASTTGNISGVYDMSGGAHDYMASYMNGQFGSSGFTAATLTSYNSKYYDVYNAPLNNDLDYNQRILGDATGELGPFYMYATPGGNAQRYHNNWYADYSNFVGSTYPWFDRGGHYMYGVLGSQFLFDRYNGEAHSSIGFRLVLTN